MIFFRCTDLQPPAPDSTAQKDEDEDLEPRTFTLDEARRLVVEGEIVDLKTAVGSDADLRLAVYVGDVKKAGRHRNRRAVDVDGVVQPARIAARQQHHCRHALSAARVDDHRDRASRKSCLRQRQVRRADRPRTDRRRRDRTPCRAARRTPAARPASSCSRYASSPVPSGRPMSSELARLVHRVVVLLVHREGEHARVAFEDERRAVAVMHVEIDRRRRLTRGRRGTARGWRRRRR